jgi:hypothetical protein
MRGVTIRDLTQQNVLDVDLKDILNLMNGLAIKSIWRMSNVSALGTDSADAMHRLSDSGVAITGERLFELANDVWQVTDGEFDAFLDGHSSPWCVIRAVDSSAYDLLTDNDSILEAIYSRYENVAQIQQ